MCVYIKANVFRKLLKFQMSQNMKLQHYNHLIFFFFFFQFSFSDTALNCRSIMKEYGDSFEKPMYLFLDAFIPKASQVIGKLNETYLRRREGDV